MAETGTSNLIRYICIKPMHLGAGSNEGYTTVNEGAWAWCPVGHQAFGHEWEQINAPMPLELARHAWRWGKLGPAVPWDPPLALARRASASAPPRPRRRTAGSRAP